jgi:glycosyltransferase involved in cell wall biosynthesis
MRVLAISYALPPALFPQAVQIGRLLAALDAEVGVVAAEKPGQPTELDTTPGFDARLAFRLNVPFRQLLSGVAADIARHVLPFYARIPDEARGWIRVAEKRVREKLQACGFRPDVMVTFGEPMSDHLLGLRLRDAVAAPWLAHFSDPWADNPFRRFNPLSNVVNRALERRVVEKADHLVFTSQETLELVMRKYPCAWRKKCSVLPHSFDPALYPPSAKAEAGLVVRFLGNFYGHRTPRPLYQAIQLVLREKSDALSDVHFELIGGMPGRMRRYRELLSLPDGMVRLRPTVSHSRALKLMVDADLLLVIDGPAALSVFLPSKLIEYLGAGVPICGIVPPGASADLLRRMGAPVADPGNPPAVADALMRSLQAVRERRTRGDRGPWGDVILRQEFAIDRIAGAFEAIMANAVAGRARGV